MNKEERATTSSQPPYTGPPFPPDVRVRESVVLRCPILFYNTKRVL